MYGWDKVGILDQDLTEKHKRVGLGFEGKASMIDLNYNLYPTRSADNFVA